MTLEHRVGEELLERVSADALWELLDFRQRTPAATACSRASAIAHAPGMSGTAMGAIDALIERSARFAERDHEELPYLPRLGMCVVTCPDPRVDPSAVLGIELGTR